MPARMVEPKVEAAEIEPANVSYDSRLTSAAARPIPVTSWAWARVAGLVGEGLRLDAEGATDCSRTIAHPELVIHVVEVFADRSSREIEHGGDLAVRLPSRNPEKNLALAGSEHCERLRLPLT